MNSGIPDWRDKSAYGDPSQKSEHQWRWEFIRRSPDYRKAWANATIEIGPKGHEENLRYCRIECRNGGDPQGPGCDCEKKWRWRGLRNPSTPAKYTMIGQMGGQPPFLTDGNGIYPAIGIPHEDMLPNGRWTVIAFDVTMPIAPQMARAKNFLNTMHERRGRKTKKRDPEKLLQQLRILDGKEQGATLKELYATLMEHHPDQNNLENIEPRMNEEYRRACELRDNFIL